MPECFARVLDGLGYATLMRRRLYAEEGFAGKRAELWLRDETLTVDYAGEPLPAYDVTYGAKTGGRGRTGGLLAVGRPTVFETPFAPDQPKLFGLAEALGEDGWLKALRLEDYAPRRPPRPGTLQQALFSYGEARG